MPEAPASRRRRRPSPSSHGRVDSPSRGVGGPNRELDPPAAPGADLYRGRGGRPHNPAAYRSILSEILEAEYHSAIRAGSGKTTLFYQLRDGSSHQGTVTSMEENDDTFVLHSEEQRKGKVKPVHVVDVPGHARLKPKLDEVLPKAAGVVFVVDAQDFLSSMQAAAEYLYDILTKATVVKKKVPLLIFCNKTDKFTVHSKEFIKKQLEKEIDKLRQSRNAISSADISDEVQLGVPGEAFSLSHCQNKVAVAEGASLTGNVSAVEQFIREHVKA